LKNAVISARLQREGPGLRLRHGVAAVRLNREGIMFRWTRIVALVAVTAALAIASGVAGATSKPGSVPAAGSHLSSAGKGKASSAAARRSALLKAANLRTRAGALRYLRAIGLKARHVVIQRGSRNYAGANCPGTVWKCTSTAYPVIQIASAGGGNTFQCATASCAVVQVADASSKPNSGTCIKTTGLMQSCSITQTGGGTNIAVVYQNTGKSTGLTQTASSTASITQRATGTNTNTACVTQAINMEGSTNLSGKKGSPINVALEAHQSITISQSSDANGSNTAANGATTSGTCDLTPSSPTYALNQLQTLSSTATGTGSITQNENAANNGANLILNITQNQNAGTGTLGTNTATFNQTNGLTATANGPGTNSLPISQTQSSVNGGILAAVNQSGPGISTASATQTETQCEDAATSGLTSCSTTDHADPGLASLAQTQFGPLRKTPGDSSQTGNSNDSFTVTQNSRQDSDSGSTQSNVVEGGYSTDGNGSVTQTTTVNGTSSTNTASGQSVNAQTNCTGSACTTTGPPSLTLLPNGMSVSHTDVGEFGVGGMRVNCTAGPTNCVQGDGTGSISVSGITGTVFRAFLYWHGPTNSTDPAANASVTVNGTPITGTNIGTASDNNWGFTNSQAYRADVTPLVTGNGTYNLSNFTKADADINGAALIVFYDDGNSSNDRNVVLWNGNDSNVAFGSDPAGWAETISGVNYPASGSASLDLVVADGQSFSDANVVLNGNTGDPVAAGPSIFQGDSVPPNMVNGLWDVKSFDITRFLTNGSNTLNLTSGTAGDALSLVVAIANVPASAPPVIP
jgi:hypothetical protein